MKNLKITLLIFICCFTLNAQEEQSDATFKETVDWLRSKLIYENMLPDDYTIDRENHISYQYELISITINEKNEIIYVFKWLITWLKDSPMTEYHDKYEYKASLNKIHKVKSEGNGKIRLYFDFQLVEEKVTVILPEKKKGKIEVKKAINLQLRFQNSDMTERIYKAFSHLAYLNTKDIPKEKF